METERYLVIILHHEMWILPLVGYTGVLLGFGFLTLAIGIANNSNRIIHPHPIPFPLNLVKNKADRTIHSKRTVLLVRVGRGAHCIRSQAPYASHLRHHPHSNPPNSDRPLPLAPFPS